MKTTKLNPVKIYSLAIFYLTAPERIRRIFHFKTSPIESIAIGTAVTKIKYWKQFLKKKPMSKKIHFSKPDNYCR
jgi:hypothetical protein